MNQYPTLFLSFKSVDGLNFGKAYEKLAAVLADLYKEHLYLRESDEIDSFSRELFDCIASQKASQGVLENSLLNLTRMMQVYYGKPVILLMDEYDVPLAKASDNGIIRLFIDFAGAGYVVESNREHGEGRSDILIQDYAGDRMAVFEVKYAKSQEGLEKPVRRQFCR